MRILQAYFSLAASGIELDIYARARTIESAFGLPKGTYSQQRNYRAFFKEGPILHPTVDPDWFSNRDNTGLADSLYTGARMILKNQGGEATAEEIVQNMIGGLSIGGGSRTDVFEDLGKGRASQIQSGKPPQAFRNTMIDWAKRRALDSWRKMQRQKSRREEMYPSLQSDEGGIEDAVDNDPRMVLLHAISDSVSGARFRHWVAETIRQKATPEQKLVVDASMDYLARTGEWPSASRISDEVNEGIQRMKGPGASLSVTMINKHRKNVEKLLARELRSDDRMLDWLDSHLEFDQSFKFASNRFTARMIKRVAARYLGLPV